MSVMTRKDVRLKLMNERVLEKIERERVPLNTPRVLHNLKTIRGQITGSSMINAVTTWERLLRSGDLDEVRRLTSRDDAPSQLLRSLSPLGILLSDHERRQALRKLSTQRLGAAKAPHGRPAAMAG